ALAGKIDLLSGSIVRSEKLNIGYFAQHQLDTIRADQNPVWHIQQLSPEVREQEIRNFLGGFNFVGDMALQKTEPFSGGEKARLALAMIIWQKPNLLLLDEPTNHLDIDAIIWLENLLKAFEGSLVVITHDRRFLDNIATRIVELDRGILRSYPGSFSKYSEKKAQELAVEAEHNRLFDKFHAQEEAWIR
ncbi:ATP-binding cassette domain-containing protein, partial [Enterobacter hormaechei subsp. steigerwaltii]|nr:ATP-binding cassette domain-containing protein [Enterobacter hormaechei subsp. steigerwaltii]